MPTDLPTEQDLIRLIVSSWVALQAGTLDHTRRNLLNQQRPDWESEAQQLLAESLLAYVTVEMVQPDLENDQAIDPMEVASPQEFTQRVQGHVLDFLEYHQDLQKVRDPGFTNILLRVLSMNFSQAKFLCGKLPTGGGGHETALG